MTTDVQVGRPSPWRGSEHFASHDWDFDDVDSLPEAASRFTAIADELMSAHSAGWWLEGPMSDGRLHARRPSRRQRTRTADADGATGTAPALRWRVRVVDEPAAATAMHRAGGRLAAVDDGFLIVEYPQR